ncbi:cytidylyltransferase domain-containing protein [Vibrio vulnificus]|uniref:acylneuraminate cytidylyltransferase family protein n=1 Tax=Vibrio vulnificus TaxID=672 RepID=UPI0019D4DF31|nr:CMP-N-acetylneuraminic acid synthetase [Vibrio vulnificus]EIX4875189.1 CMP-N-acetylneuraminic acid synthetase [Vibrio vulnificus]ELR8747406.1 CMP-N-acetylneuraminic acid synthetase [Vibrio vulnificus]MBN8034091.1 CMP-N-acetylneuraminic acid synthetase [Vibrio vulnificus]HAS8556300.1 CMP-N-acetylneuraminic acid synthetase [Vibrio vulnificus]
MKVIIPLQTCSTRVPEKNIRNFCNGESLFDIKIKQLLNVFEPENIYVSSESNLVKSLCEKKGVNFIYREAEFTGNLVKQPDLIGSILKKIPSDNDDIMWVQVTSPLFNEFQRGIEEWEKIKHLYDSLVAVKEFKGHVLDNCARPINYSFGHWHSVSQSLPEWYTVLWSMFILKRSAIEEYKYHIGVNPYLFVTECKTIDIDTMDDFELASFYYEKLINNS